MSPTVNNLAIALREKANTRSGRDASTSIQAEGDDAKQRASIRTDEHEQPGSSVKSSCQIR